MQPPPRSRRSGDGPSPPQPSSTVIRDGERGVGGHGAGHVPSKPADSKAGRIDQPTMIAGKEPQRLPVTIDDLTAIAPGADSRTHEAALQMLRSYAVRDDADRVAVLWGYELQQEYAALVSESLSLSQDNLLIRVNGHLTRMIEILRRIDMEAVAAGGRPGALTRVFRNMNARVDTPAELQAARLELEQLVKLMEQATKDLLALKDQIGRTSAKVESVGERAEAAALAAEFLSSYYQPTSAELAGRFQERSMSLTQTALQIRGSAVFRETQVEQPLRLISAIQNVALVMVPAWLGSIASLTTLAQGRTPTPTEATELAYQLRSILEQLPQ